MQATTQPAEQEEEAIFRTAVDAIIVMDAGSHITKCNPAAARMFGWDQDSLVGMSVSELMPLGFGPPHKRYVERYLTTGREKIIGRGRKVIARRRDGEEFPVHLSVGSYSAGKERFFVGILHDLTSEELERQRLRELQSQLHTIGQHCAVSEMGAALAHELNQPLTAIDLFVSAAERELDQDPEKARELFHRVRSEVDRAGKIIRRIRQMVERGDGERAFFRLQDAISNATDLCRVVDASGGEAISVEHIPDTEVFGDEIQIRQILVNLIKNALDATAGQVDRQIEISAQIGDQIEIDVRDNGPGVKESFLPSLFSAFATTKEHGLGIGLSICKTLAEAHGGRLSYLPRKQGSGGAVFRLMLPIVTETQTEERFV